jgi:nucleotide-binding universal stress UspA family protein
MAYASILVHVDGDAACAARIRLAAMLASSSGAHLLGAAATGVSRFLFHSLPTDHSDPTLAAHQALLRSTARLALDAFSSHCAQEQVASYTEHIIDDDAAPGLNLLGRTVDLLVLGQPAAAAPALSADLAGQVVCACGRPVLLAPARAVVTALGQRIVVAWDGGREAARALQLALPLLRTAEDVRIAVCEVAGAEHALEDALATNPCDWLARHGVDARLMLQPLQQQQRLHRRQQVGERLLAMATEVGADLLVMGAYGHSRFRTTELGGITRTVMAKMTLPVLMAN